MTTRPSDEGRCDLCGEPMPEGESMFKFHGYSGPCPKPPLPIDGRGAAMTPIVYDPTAEVAELRDELHDLNIELTRARKERDQAIARIKDMLQGDDGQAWKEARKFIERIER